MFRRRNRVEDSERILPDDEFDFERGKYGKSDNCYIRTKSRCAQAFYRQASGPYTIA